MAFKIGDRVRVYGWVRMHQSPFTSRQGGTGSIIWVDGQDMHVKFDRVSTTGREDLTHYLAHPKQCRRLVKRERRRILVEENPEEGAFPRTWLYCESIHGTWPAYLIKVWMGPGYESVVPVIPCIEVRRKK